MIVDPSDPATPEVVFDTVRVVALVTGSAVLAMTAVVGFLYFRIFRQHKAQVAAGDAEPWRGLLPRHVTLVAVSYSLLTMLTLGVLMDKLRSTPTSFGPICLVAYLAGIWALWDVLGNVRHRSRGLEEERT